MRHTASAALALAIVASVTSCGHSPTAPRAAAAPATPATALEVANFVQSDWRTRSESKYQLLLSADYHFEFAPWDSAWFGQPPWSRADEESCALHLFETGTPWVPPAKSITFDFLAPPSDSADPRPGMNPKWHRMLTLLPSVWIYYDDGAIQLTGREQLYVVRGDSASIPADLVATGVKPDTTRWWLDRWVDATPDPGFRAVPVRSVAAPRGAQALSWWTWGRAKALYR